MAFVRIDAHANYQALSSDSLPTTGVKRGDACYLTDTGVSKVFDGANWQTLSGGTFTGSIDTTGLATDAGQTTEHNDLAAILATLGPASSLDHQTAAANTQVVSTITGPHRIAYVVVNYDAAVSTTITVVKTSANGSGYNALMLSQALSSNANLVMFPLGDLSFGSGDSLVVTAPAVASRTASVEVYGW